MKRTYHGCEIESTPEKKTTSDSDGWLHIVRIGGKVIGEADTLGKAIQVAKNYKPETEAKPVPKEKATK